MTTAGNNRSQQAPRSELARILLALADPIRLRMLNLMKAGALSPEQFAQLLGIAEKSASRHLVFFRESGLVATRTRNNVKFYTIRKGIAERYSRLLSLTIELLEEDSVLSADVAIFNSAHEEDSISPRDQVFPAEHFEANHIGH